MGSQFDSCAQEYHNFRPGYPESLFHSLCERFALVPGDLVIDVGCGTGRAALPWRARGLALLGIDPGLEMLRLAREAAGDQPLSLVVGRAEELALRDSCARLVSCGQAFHWFDAARALGEFARVLVSGGGLALYWNNRDADRAPYLRAVEELIVRYNPRHQLAYRAVDWGAKIAASGRFQEIGREDFYHEATVSTEDIVGLTRSFSYVRNALDTSALAAFERDLRALLADYADKERLPLPYRLELWHARKR